MLFNSLAFLGFLVAVVGFHSLPLPWVVRKFNLLVASYVFYAAWNPWFTLLLVFATLTNWTAARVISKWDTFPGRRSVVLWLDVVLNIGLLSAFKYGNELLGVLQWVAGPCALFPRNNSKHDPVARRPFVLHLPGSFLHDRRVSPNDHTCKVTA